MGAKASLPYSYLRCLPFLRGPYHARTFSSPIRLIRGNFFAFYAFHLCATQSLPVSPICPHRVFWIGCRIEIFGSRSTLLRPILHDTRLTSGFAGASTDGCCVFIHCPCTSAWPTRARELVSLSGTWRPYSSLTPSLDLAFGGSPWNQRSLLMRATQRQHVVLTRRQWWLPIHHPQPTLDCCLCYDFCFYFLVFMGFYVSATSPCSSLSRCLGPQGSLHTTNHLNWWPRFLAFVPRTIIPSLEVLPSRTYLLSFYFGLPKPCCIFFL
jgi:hypothetical protein